MAVQWHPERMKKDHPFAAPLAKCFVKAAIQYQKDKQDENK
jgi:gamma-glutamyl-gamma-aminobutyrate hydrolase PuuD